MDENNHDLTVKDPTNISTDTLPEHLLPNQTQLDFYVETIEQQIGRGHLVDFSINPLSKHVPTIVVVRESYLEVAKCLKEHPQLQFEYISDLHGTDFQTYFEVYVYLYSFSKRQSIALKVKVDRDEPFIPSLTTLWAGANWPECEIFDLLGIQFTGHPDLKRILLGEEWVGYPLRKEYEPHDAEV